MQSPSSSFPSRGETNEAIGAISNVPDPTGNDDVDTAPIQLFADEYNANKGGLVPGTDEAVGGKRPSSPRKKSNNVSSSPSKKRQNTAPSPARRALRVAASAAAAIRRIVAPSTSDTNQSKLTRKVF
mmetsp:Transcript_27697/g.47131  ORF Transcript_27697/g.47131 Transcript_27697/m.47131 type:complete len:127 (-) Transcript_27697:376-756(-)